MKIQELNVYLVAFYKDKLLLLKRKNDLWEFPGGSVDWGENPVAAAQRELKEETGLTASDVSFLGITSAVFKKDNDEKHAVYIVYKGNASSDRVIISGEHKEARWLTSSEAKYLKLGINAEPILDMI